MAGPPVRRGERHDTGRSAKEPCQQIGLVVMGMHHVDRLDTHQFAQRAPDRGIERIALADLDVVDTGRRRPAIDTEHRITRVA